MKLARIPDPASRHLHENSHPAKIVAITADESDYPHIDNFVPELKNVPYFAAKIRKCTDTEYKLEAGKVNIPPVRDCWTRKKKADFATKMAASGQSHLTLRWSYLVLNAPSVRRPHGGSVKLRRYEICRRCRPEHGSADWFIVTMRICVLSWTKLREKGMLLGGNARSWRFFNVAAFKRRYNVKSGRRRSYVWIRNRQEATL